MMMTKRRIATPKTAAAFTINDMKCFAYRRHQVAF